MMLMITDFGDMAVLLPLSLVILFCLIAGRSFPSVSGWLLAVGLCIGGITLLKIYFHACHVPRDVFNPSGHAGFSVLVYGGLAVVLSANTKAVWEKMVVVLGIATFFLIIAVSRLVLGFHSGSEIILGIAIGVVSLAAFARTYLQKCHNSASPTLMLCASAVVVAITYGHELPAEQMLDKISTYSHVGDGL